MRFPLGAMPGFSRGKGMGNLVQNGVAVLAGIVQCSDRV
jgi:hypothetical protein